MSRLKAPPEQIPDPRPPGRRWRPALEMGSLYVLSIGGALFISAVLVAITGNSWPKVFGALLDGAFTVKRILKRGGRMYLAPDNPALEPVEVSEERDFEVWGVVTYAIHPVK